MANYFLTNKAVEDLSRFGITLTKFGPKIRLTNIMNCLLAFVKKIIVEPNAIDNFQRELSQLATTQKGTAILYGRDNSLDN